MPRPRHHRVCALYPANFVGVCQLPQAPGVRPDNCTAELTRDNVYFDTCVYHRPGIELLLKVVPVDNILFASEMVGAVRGIDPESGHHYDDTKRYIDAIDWLGAAEREKIFRWNVERVYPRLTRRR